MQNFKNYITERYVNLFKPNEKSEYAQEVFDMVTKAYASLGGMKGSGFSSADDMVKNIPFWKLVRKDGKIIAGTFYKDKAGRKTVASFTDGTAEGKAALAKIMKEDMTRSYKEVSKASLGFGVKTFGVDFIKQFAMTPEEAQKKLGPKKKLSPVPEDDSHVKKFPELKDFFYQRELMGKLETKIMLGK